MYETIRASLRRLERTVDKLRDNVTALAATVAAVNAKTQRTGVTIGPLSIGSSDVAIAWPKPWPDTSYAVVVELVAATATLGNLHATLKVGSKTTTDCVITVASLANIGSVGLDVIGIRT